jgi:hypothetical protein
MAKLAQVGQLPDIPLAVEAVVEGRAPSASELLELARANRRRAVRMVFFIGKS